MDTTSIINRPSIDTNTIMAEEFDVNAFISDIDKQRVSLLRRDPLTSLIADEVEDKYKMSAFVESIVGIPASNHDQNALILAALTQQENVMGTWESVRNSWRNGRRDMDTAELGWEMLNGWRPYDSEILKTQELQTGSDNWFESSLNSASNMLPMMFDTAIEGGKYGATAAATAGLIAAVAGQAGPQVALPEEAVTVPLSMGGGFVFGAMVGGTIKATEIEAGLQFAALSQMKGPNGEQLDFKSMRAISLGVGIINGLIEVAQIDEIIKTIPGGKKLLRKGINQAIKKAIRNKSLVKIASKHLFAYGKTITTETLQELGQESTSILGDELAKFLHNAANKGKIPHATVDEIMQRYKDTAKNSIQAFSVIALPGHIGGSVVDIVDNQGISIKPRVSQDTELTRVTDIRPRIDPKTLTENTNPLTGKPIVPLTPEEAEALTKPEREVGRPIDQQGNKGNIRNNLKEQNIDQDLFTKTITKMAEQGKTPSQIATTLDGMFPGWRQIQGFAKDAIWKYVEEHQSGADPRSLTEILKKPIPKPEAKVPQTEIEQKIQAELPSKVKPKLYIGNITRRMKKKFAEIFGTEEGDIGPFLDGPFPTKRTEIEMTADQAMGTLVMLEASLDQRLNDNLIGTENELARANADWGDIKELRKALELPKKTRPFTVTRAKKPTIIVPGAIKQRVEFSVQLSKADKITTSRIDQLNNVMRRVRAATNKGIAFAKKEFRELQKLRKEIQLRKELVAKIKSQPSKSLDPFYAKAIDEIQSAIDFRATAQKVKGKKITKVQEKESLRKHIENNPDNANEIPALLLEALDKRDVESLSLSQLQEIVGEIKRLSKLGRLKSKLMRKQRKAKLAKMSQSATSAVKAAKGSRFTQIKAWALRPLRIFDMLDGGKNFTGPIVNMFDTQVQDATDSELRNVDFRQQKGMAKLKELGLTLFGLARRRKVGDITLTVDEMVGIYAAWMNNESQLALQHGGIRLESGRTVRITEDLFEQVLNALSNEEKKWAEFIIEEYADNWTRIRAAVIEAENRDLGRHPNYTKIRRLGVDKTKEGDILSGFDYSDEQDYRGGIVKVDDRFTKERKKIPPEFQLPIDVSLTRVWQSEIRKQEHYIAMAKLLKDLEAVTNNSDFKESVTEKFGEPIYKSIKGYLKRVANPDYYRSFDDLENLSRILRKNTAIAYLAYNLLTVTKQVPSLMLYAVDSSFSDLLMSAVQVAVNPKKTYEAILSHNVQIGNAAIIREMEELKRSNRKVWQFIVRKIGTSGLRGIYEIDRIVRVIGENAVINNQLRKGMSLNEATGKARQTSLRTQPAAGAKDIAQLYANNEALNWFTMFTNQLNQIYNVATYDIPAAWHNKRFAEVGRSVVALATIAGWIWTLQNKELPEEKEEILDALLEQSLASIPIIGSAALAGKRGWDAPTPSPISTISRLVKAIDSGNTDRIAAATLEAASISVGAPFVGAKRVVETAKEQDLWELIGGKK